MRPFDDFNKVADHFNTEPQDFGMVYVSITVFVVYEGEGLG